MPYECKLEVLCIAICWPQVPHRETKVSNSKWWGGGCDQGGLPGSQRGWLVCGKGVLAGLEGDGLSRGGMLVAETSPVRVGEGMTSTSSGPG